MTTRKRRTTEETRQAILDAARELISERGAYNVSLRAIARRIQHSPAGLYEYFGSKDEIVEAVVREGFDRFAAYLGSVPHELHPMAYLEQLGLSYVRFALENPQHFMLIFNTISVYEGGTPEYYIPDATFSLLTNGLQRAMDAGEISADHDIDISAYAAWSIVHGMATLQLTQLDTHTHDFETATETALQQWLEGLR